MRVPTAFWSILLVVLSAQAAHPAEPGPAKHRFLGIDNGRNRLLCVDQHDAAKSWSVPIPPGSRDLQLLDRDRVLVSHANGAAEYDLATGRKLDWVVDRYQQINSAQRLADGHTLLGANTRAGVVLYELDRGGREVGTRVLKGLKDLRLLRPVGEGHVLMTVADPCRVVEVDGRGKIAWQAPLPGKGYEAVRLPNGRTMVSTGGALTVIELDPAGKVTLTVGGQKAHPDLGLGWFSGFDLLPNGHIVVANWLGHGKQGKGPHVVEFDRNNRLVWKWEDYRQAATVTNVLVLDR